MINWKRMSHDKLKHKWTSFILARKKSPNGIKSDHQDHITSLERESLISQLIWRLDMANGVIDSYHQLKTCIEQDEQNEKCITKDCQQGF